MKRGTPPLARINLRCKFSDKWISINRHKEEHYRKMTGTVLYETKAGLYMVLFDGEKSTRSYHKNFIEIIQ